MINSIRLKNFRSLIDSELIEFRPITLLLGQNSSGKSSVLRFLPLIKQSLQTRTSAPILWYGDYVDFGSMREVLSTLTEDGFVQIEFNSERLTLNEPFVLAGMGRYLEQSSLRLSLYNRDESTKVSGFQLAIGADCLDVQFDSKQVVRSVNLNGIDHTKLYPTDRYRFITTGIVPQLQFTGRASSRDPLYYYTGLKPNEPGFRELASLLQGSLHGRIGTAKVNALVRRIRYSAQADFLAKLQSISSQLTSWHRYVEELSKPYKQQELERMRQWAFLAEAGSMLAAFAASVSATFAGSAYIGPARATGERYYRHQELAVDQIDAQGHNLPMFLYSLSPALRDSFSDWLAQSLGYHLKVTRVGGGHLQIELKESGKGQYHNLADMGYGFSQILPVLAQIWAWTHLPSRNIKSPFIAMEQPELHLHPAYQSRLADILCQALVPANSGPTRATTFVVETHSEPLINRLGELIYQGVISPEAVAIYIFERQSGTEATAITRSHFDENGALLNWPIGFFSAIA